jgi:uncharacterized protein
MLIRLRLTNYRSFANTQEFGYAASSDRSHDTTHCLLTGLKSVPRLSRAAVVFGPNGSGKTNLLSAFVALRELVLFSTGLSERQFRDLHTPFHFGPSAHAPTAFEIDVFIGGVRYQYSVSHDAERIRFERLLVYRTARPQRWFEREYDPASNTERWRDFSPRFHGPRETWRRATREKALFLTTAAQLNSAELKPLMQWFENGFRVLFPADLRDVGDMAAQLQDPRFKEHVIGLLRSIDIHVEDLRVAEPDAALAGAGIPRAGDARHPVRPGATPSIECSYAKSPWQPLWLGPMSDSAGTHQLLGLFMPLVTAIADGGLLIIDEFDRSLHPLVARLLLQLINDPRVSRSGAQLLATTHNTSLMDLEFLRRDEIWLIDLDPDRSSRLTPIVQFHPRKRELIGKAYLRGRYGAVPAIRTELAVVHCAAEASARRSGG